VCDTYRKKNVSLITVKNSHIIHIMETKAHFNTFIYYDFIQYILVCGMCAHAGEGERERGREGGRSSS